METETLEQVKANDMMRTVAIAKPNFDYAHLTIRGTTPLVLHNFSQRIQNQIRATQEEGSRSRKGKVRAEKDFDEAYEGARHIAARSRRKDDPIGWDGIHAGAFRNAGISACRMSGFKMTHAKLSLFIIEDGWEANGTPLVKITKGEPKPQILPVRNATGVIDLRCRPTWDPGWEAILGIRWDRDQFGETDVINLYARVGLQVGIGEGRPDSKDSAGCGWGLFEVL